MQTVSIHTYGDCLTFGSFLSRLSYRLLGSLFLTGRGVGCRHRRPFRGLGRVPIRRAPLGVSVYLYIRAEGRRLPAHARGTGAMRNFYDVVGAAYQELTLSISSPSLVLWKLLAGHLGKRAPMGLTEVGPRRLGTSVPLVKRGFVQMSSPSSALTPATLPAP